MKRLGLCAATIAITGVFGISSQAGMGILVTGGNSSGGQNPAFSGSFSGGSCDSSTWGKNLNQGSNAGQNYLLQNSAWNIGGQNITVQNPGCGTGNTNSFTGNNSSSLCPDNSFPGKNWLNAIYPGFSNSDSSCLDRLECPDTYVPSSGNYNGNCFTWDNINGGCLNPIWPDFNCPEEKPDENKPGTNKPDENNPDTNKPGENNPDGSGNGNSSGDSGGSGTGGNNSGNSSGSVNPPNQDEEISYLIQQVIDLVNEERAKAGLSPLTESAPLMDAAALRAQEITKSFSHTRPDGTSFSTAIRQSGATFNGSGENIAYGQQSAKAVMNTWMNSQTHRANILKSQFTKIGVGCYIDSRGVKYWTQLFTY